MNKLAQISIFILSLSIVIGCTPDQEATQYTIADQIVSEEPVGEMPNPKDSPGFPSDPAEPSYRDTVANCDDAQLNNSLLETTYTVSFPAAIECQFNEAGNTKNDINAAGNGPRIDGWMMARNETYQSIDFPADATLCDAEFNFPEQSMKYDDEIFLTMNNNILIASTDFSAQTGDDRLVNGLATNDLGLVQWNWMGDNGLYNLAYVNTPKYCLGLSPSDPEYDQKCNIPETDTLGQMKLDLPANEAIKLNMKNNTDQIQFGFITTGDNDNGDCEHSAYSFEVRVKYIQE